MALRPQASDHDGIAWQPEVDSARCAAGYCDLAIASAIGHCMRAETFLVGQTRMPTPRTSQTHPLQIAEVRATPSHGRIGITFCPGKHDPFAHTGAWERDLGSDLDAIAAWGARLVLTLLEPAELVALKVPSLGQEIQRRGIAWLHLPIADYSVPTEAFEHQWVTQGCAIRERLRHGDDVLVHCRGGLGRAGMIAARLLVELGVDTEEAIRSVRRARRGAIETPAQLALVRRIVPLP